MSCPSDHSYVVNPLWDTVSKWRVKVQVFRIILVWLIQVLREKAPAPMFICEKADDSLLFLELLPRPQNVPSHVQKKPLKT